MVQIYQKFSQDKLYFYLVEKIRINKKTKKLQVYLGKKVPKNLDSYYLQLAKKEKVLIKENLNSLFLLIKFLTKSRF